MSGNTSRQQTAAMAQNDHATLVYRVRTCREPFTKSAGTVATAACSCTTSTPGRATPTAAHARPANAVPPLSTGMPSSPTALAIVSPASAAPSSTGAASS